jgi:glyoxylase-like metal-dependent hydrolase (beta-lactamase superfamily II)
LITYTLNLTNDRIIHQYKGRASNIYIIADNRKKMSFLVDCGMPSDAKSLATVLGQMPPLKRIVCTHFHVDHISGWIHLKSIFKDCSVWFHEKGKPSVTGRERIAFPSFDDLKKVLIPCMREAHYFPSLTDLLTGGLYGTPFVRGFPLDRVEFFAGDQEVLPGFITLHTPGHRPESVSFFDSESGVIVTGDFIIVIDGGIAQNSFLTSEIEQQASINRIRRIKGIRTILAGHGVCRPFSPKDLP